MALSGVTYYKRIEKYSGDTTKNCGLAGGEIDDNFYFLRGADIESIAFESGETNNIIIHKINGETLSCALPEFLNSVDLTGSKFNPETGILSLVVNGGEPYEIPGFSSCDCKEIMERLDCVEAEVDAINEHQNVQEGLIEELRTDLDKEIKDARKAEKTIENSLAEEVERAEVKEEEILSSLETESNRATQAEKDLKDKYDKVEAALSSHTEDIASLNERMNAVEDIASGISKYDERIENLEEQATEFENELEEEKATRYENDKQLNRYIDDNFHKIEELDGRVTDLEKDSHTHNNKEILDDITGERTDSWDDAAEKAHVHDNKEILDGIDAEDIENWDNAEARSKKYTDEKILEVRNEVSVIAESVDVIEGEILLMEDKISAITDDIESMHCDISAITSDIELINSGISAITEEIELINYDISSITETVITIENEVSGITQDIVNIREDISAITNDITNINIYISLMTENIDSIEKRVTAIEETGGVILEEVKISPLSPFYSLVKGLWENDTIPSGSTLTEILKIMFEAPKEEMIYYISSAKPKKVFIENNIIDISDNEFERIKIKDITDNTFVLESRHGSITTILLLPKEISAKITILEDCGMSINGDVTNLFENTMCTIKNDESGTKYNAYFVELDDFIESSTENYKITLLK